MNELSDKVRNRRSTLEAIRQYLLGNLDALTEKEEQVYERLLTVQVMRKFASTSTVLKRYRERFQVSEVTAMKDLRTAKQLFGDLNASMKEGLRSLWLDRADETWLLAAQQKDSKAMATAAAVAARLLGNPDKETFIPDQSQLGNNIFIFGGSAKLENSVLQLVEGIKQSGRIDLSKFPIENAEYEDIRDGDTSGDSSDAQTQQ